jgi:hypothetical protein
VKLGRSHSGRNVGRGSLRIGRRGEYFGPRRDEVTEKWRKPHNEELNDLYSSPNIIQVIKARTRWPGGGRKVAYRVLVGKPEGKRPLVRPMRRWEHNSKMDLQVVGLGRGRVWPGLIGFRIGTRGGHL